MDIFFYSPCRPVSYRYLLCGDIYRFYRNPTLKEIHSFIGKGEVLIKHYDIWPCLPISNFSVRNHSRSYKRSQCSIFDAVLLEEIESSHDRTRKLYLNSVVLSLTLVLILLSELPCLKWANKAIKQITFVLRGLPWFGSTFV